ncbi:hypothetical protein EYD45_09270 [Hyunsoonleella flava]|uniref:Alpha glucuronidase N-terminal domain-containing protein n=1 Tax=Hyunsoonleella flava TaxID=2527939 RepID=A0A4Q9FJ25_9FLAO|nr:hypothetical protein [Hyunsoonleella flava]TBN03697.1 hypothetical protein EYD45_09270 [Hyunsoonleella flava]
MIKKLKVICYFLILSIFVANFAYSQPLNQNKSVIKSEILIIDRTAGSNTTDMPVDFGKREFFKALREAGLRISVLSELDEVSHESFVIIGTLNDSLISNLLKDNTNILNASAESVFYEKVDVNKYTALIIGGSDSKGLMYALTEMSEQIKDKGLSVLEKLQSTLESPENKVRGLDRFIKDENDDNWFFSEEFWQYYIQQLAKNRFNRLTLITGYNDGKKEDFMIPVYPYFFQVPGFQKTKIKKNLKKSPQDYLSQLRRIGEISHDYGLEFVFGIWGHGRSEGLVEGLAKSDIEYTQYCSKGMQELLKRVPEIDGIQLRVNYESGIGGFGNTADEFWKEIIYAIGKANSNRNGNLFLDIRAKGLTPKIRKWATETEIDFSVTSKYTWEGVGLPYHPLQMRKAELDLINNFDKRQRYGYADFLNESRNFDFIYRLWGIGTKRMFTWADPDYAKRFSHSSSFGKGKGFQVTPPMARKSNTWSLITNESKVYYKWEDERYWAWYLLFGRLGYSTDTNPEVWQRTFKQHYGNAYPFVLDAYSAAGKVLPLITSSHLTNHPANYNWAEMDSGGALFTAHNANWLHKEKERTYQSAEPGDPGMFYSIQDYVKDVLNENIQPKITPIQLADYYNKLADEILENLSKVKLGVIPEESQKEFQTNIIDLKITAALSTYHAEKVIASMNFVFYQETEDEAYLHLSIQHLKKAKSHWETIVNLTSKIYHTAPFFLHDNGTWKDRLTEIEKDLESLVKIQGKSKQISVENEMRSFGKTKISFSNGFDAIVPTVIGAKDTLKVIFNSNKFTKETQIPSVHYRLADMTLGEFNKQKMTWNGSVYVAQISIESLNPDYDLLVYFSSITSNEEVVIYPGIFSEKQNAPFYTIEIEE